MVLTLELIAQELQSMVGCGAKPLHCVRRPNLRDFVLSQRPELKDKPQKVIGATIVSAIAEAIKLSKYPAAYGWLLIDIDGKHAWRRREIVIEMLGLKISWETWRGEREFKFMRELAEVLVDGAEPVRKEAFCCPRCGQMFYCG